MKNRKPFVFLILVIILSMVPNVLLVFIGEDSVVGTIVKQVIYLIIGLSIIILPLSFLRPKYFTWLIIFMFPLLIFETYNVYQFKAPSSEEAVASIFLTNYGETLELLQGSFQLVLLIILILIVLIFLGIKIKRNFLLHKNVRIAIAGFTALTLISLYARNYLMSKKLNDNYTETIGFANYSFGIQMRKVYPIDIILKLQDAFNGIQKKKGYLENVKDFRFQAIKRDSLENQEIYVLVIGETARKHNFSLYGYERETSPNLDTISNITYFENVYSSANLTSLSIPFMLTRATPNEIDTNLNEPAVISTFKESGFKTYWITNQPSGIGSVFGFYSGLADYYKNTSVSMDALNYDNNMIAELEVALNDTSTKKKFIVLHTLGSHFRYNYRYPSAFEKFKPSLTRGLSIENSTSLSNKPKLINSYDNSILYTDYILSRFISSLEKQNAISFLYYISDHGENLYDDSSNKLMHAFINPTKFEIEIPLIIWNSYKYKQTYPFKIQNLQKNRLHKIASTHTFHTLLDLANIRYPSENLSKSFAHKEFDTIGNRYFYRTNKTILKLD